MPEAQGLRFTGAGDPQTERFGTLTVVRRSFRFSGPSGHYEIQPMTIQRDVEGESKRCHAIHFCGCKRAKPREGELTDIAEPAQI